MAEKFNLILEKLKNAMSKVKPAMEKAKASMKKGAAEVKHGIDTFLHKLRRLGRAGVKRKVSEGVNNAGMAMAEKQPAKIKNLRKFVDRHQNLVLATFIVFVTVAAGIIWVVNYNTAYEYSYNGKTLGVVKDKETVLELTDVVQRALSEDENVEVVLDEKDDFEFKRVAIIGSDIHVDTDEDVLRKLTYVEDINVKGYCIVIDGNIAAVLDSEEKAEAVLDQVRAGYVQQGDNVVVEKAAFVEDVKIQKKNISLDKLNSEAEAVDILMTKGTRETTHTVVAGETFASVASTYGLSEEELLKLNPKVDPAKLEVGSNMKIVQAAPMLTLEASQLVTYEEVIPFEIVEEKTDQLYEGDTDIQVKGVEGKRIVTARVETVNGQTSTTTPIVQIRQSEPVTQKVLVGTAERPPSVGDGKFIWPAKSGTYRVSSEFGYRWGRNHNGIDLACSQGTNVLAADGGIVKFAGYKGSFGKVVIIDHQNGYETYYAHNSQLLVSAGDEVYEGYHIAESGNTGRSTGPHIHFEIRKNGTPYNPRKWLP